MQRTSRRVWGAAGLMWAGLVWMATGGAAVCTASPISFSDDFEGAALNPFWTVVQQNGTVTLSTDQAHTGAQSAKFTSTSGGQRELHLLHDFGAPVEGRVSTYFYDVAPGQQTLYEQMTLRSAADPAVFFTIGTQDFDANCYVAFIAGPGSGVQGPGGTCGGGSRPEATSVSRTLGWHLFEIDVQSAGLSFFIDSVPVFSVAGPYSFDRVDLFMSGPAFRPNTVAYVDGFSVNGTTPDPVPEPGTLLLLGGGLLALCGPARAARKGTGLKP